MYLEKNIAHFRNSNQAISELEIADWNNLSANDLISIASKLNCSIDRLVNLDLASDTMEIAKSIKLLILDVDGVMTDGGMYFTENGDQFKKYNTKDGMAIIHLTRNNFQVGIISSGFKGEAVRQRAEMLGIQNFYLGRGKKMEVLVEWCSKMNISLSEVAMIGDDVNDLPVLKEIGLAVCPKNAVQKVQDVCHIILESNGGDACVREFVDTYLPFNVEY